MKKNIATKCASLIIILLAAVLNVSAQTGTIKIKEAHPNKKILIVLSAADHWTRADGSLYPSGYWAEEFVDVHKKFIEAGYIVNLATPGGVKPTADPKSLSPDVVGAKATVFTNYLKELAMPLEHPLPLSKVKMARYDAIVIPGAMVRSRICIKIRTWASCWLPLIS